MNTPSPLSVQVDYMGMWHICLFVGLALLCAAFLRKAPLFAIPLWALVVGRALYQLLFPGAQFGVYNLAFQASAGETLAMAMILPGAMLCLSDEEEDRIMRALAPVMVWEIACIWLKRDGLLIAPSFDTALLALYLPFAPVWLAIASLATILTHHGATAQLIVLAEIAALAMVFRRVRLAALVVVPLLIAVAYFHSHGALFDGSERIMKWTHYLKWWQEDTFRLFFGAGAGSFLWISVMMDKFQPPLFLHMHSDWLQILFEYGFVGLALTGIVGLEAVRRAWKNEDLACLAGLAGVAAFFTTYHPLRFFPSALLVALILRRALLSYKQR